MNPSINKERDDLLNCLSEKIQLIFLREEPSIILGHLWRWVVCIIEQQPKTTKKKKDTIQLLFDNCHAMINEAYALLLVANNNNIKLSGGCDTPVVTPLERSGNEVFSDERKRSLMFAGKINFLDYEYCLNPYPFLESFFSFASVTEWESILETWYKLFIVGDHKLKKGYKRKILTCYEYLCRFIEACYILQETEYNCIPTDPLSHYFIRDVLPIHCSPENIYEPFSTINWILANTEKSSLKTRLRNWATMAQTPKIKFPNAHSSQVVQLYFDMNLFIELVFMIRYTHFFYPKWLDTKSWHSVRKPYHDELTIMSDNHLTKDEYRNPFLVLEKEIDIELYFQRETLNEWLTAVFSKTQKVKDTTKDLMKFYRIIEAMELINARLCSDKPLITC